MGYYVLRKTYISYFLCNKGYFKCIATLFGDYVFFGAWLFNKGYALFYLRRVFMKIFLNLFLALCLIFCVIGSLPVGVSASASGTCGANLTWVLDDNGTLTISGTGNMYDYVDPSSVPTPSKAAPWYSNRLKVKALKVDSGVTSIGDYAFYECDMKSADLPNGIKTIGSHSFYKCGFKKMSLPDSITKIGAGAFSWCTWLEEINIPESCKEIGTSPFYLSAIKELYIPENVENFMKLTDTSDTGLVNYKTKYGSEFFYLPYTLEKITVSRNNKKFSSVEGVLYDKSGTKLLCYPQSRTNTSYSVPEGTTTVFYMNGRNVTDVYLPESLTKIFSLSAKYTTLHIPKNVNYIWEGEYGYGIGGNNLENVYVNEKNTTYTSQDGVLYDYAKKTLLYYPPSKKSENFTVPSSVRIISSHTSGNKYLKKLKISDGVVKINPRAFVFSSNLIDIEIPASVTDIPISAFNDGCYKLTTISGYSETRAERFASERGLIFNELNNNSSENLDTSNFSTEIIYNDVSYNLLSQAINIDEDSKAEVSVWVYYKNLTSNEKIYLSQNSAKFVELENGVTKTFKPTDSFDKDNDIYILIVNEKTGESRSEKTRLKIIGGDSSGEFMPGGEIDGYNFKVGKETGFTIPSGVPIFEGTEIKWDIDLIPFSIELDREDDNKYNVVFGINILHSDNEESKYFKDFNFKKYKEDIKEAYSKLKNFKNLRKDFSESQNCKMNLFGGKVLGGGKGKKNCDFEVEGYAEFKIIDGKPKFIEGQVCFEVEASCKYEGQLFIWVVPVYYEIGAGFGMELEGNLVDINPEGFAPKFDGYLNLKIEAEVGAGIGVTKVATVGASGEGEFNLKSGLNKDYLKSWVEGEANFKVKVFGKEVAKKTFAKGNYLIYETGNSKGLLKDKDIAIVGNGENGRFSPALYSLYRDIDINNMYENESRAYASNTTEWYGDLPPISLLDAEYTSKNMKLLAENVYTESAPIMSDINGKKVMVMLWDNYERDDVNRTMLVYSVYDDETELWSAPVPVYDDGTADFYPCFNDGYLVWQNEKSLLDDSMSLLDISKLGEICVSKWNGTGFDNPVVLTDNDTLDTQPFVCAYETGVSVVWTTNSENDILGTSGRNSILQSSLDNSVWSNPKVIKEDLNLIAGLSVGYTDSGLLIAYVCDDDNNLGTIDDRDIFIISEKGEYNLTDNDILNSNPQIKGDTIYYYSDGNIKYSVLGNETSNNVFTEEKVGLTDNFAVSENKNGDVCILWAKPVDGSTEIFAVLQKDGKWSDEIQISEVGNQSKYPTAVLCDDGLMHVAFNNSIGQDGEIVQSDLYTIDVVPSYDLEVTDAYIDEDTMTVYALVKNTGEINIDSYTVALIDDEINSQKEVTEGLKAGETAEIEIEYIKPETLDKRTITFSVTTDNEEYNLDNNSVNIIVGNCDVDITGVKSHENLPVSVAVATVSNNGYSDTGKVTVCLRKEKADGEVVETQTIDNISANQSEDITFNYNIIENENILWYVTAKADNEEISLGNNDIYFINNYSSTVSDFGCDILRYSISDNSLFVNAYVENNTDTDLTDVSIILAVYNSKGILKTVKSDYVSTYQYDSSSPDFTVDNYTYENGDYIRLFLWSNDLLDPVCEPKYCTITVEKAD